jgi:hypothetical protein
VVRQGHGVHFVNASPEGVQLKLLGLPFAFGLVAQINPMAVDSLLALVHRKRELVEIARHVWMHTQTV